VQFKTDVCSFVTFGLITAFAVWYRREQTNCILCWTAFDWAGFNVSTNTVKVIRATG